MDELVQREVEGPVATLTLNRPRQLNAVDPELLASLDGALDAIEGDPAIRAVVLAGAGRAFCAGADIAALAAMDDAAAFGRYLAAFHETLDRIEVLDRPVVAAVAGLAYGGGLELALACDLRVAGPASSFGVPEITIGVLPGAGGTQRLPRLVPETVAREMLMLGEPLDAEAAHHHGLVNRVVADEEVGRAAAALAERLAALPPLALAEAKRLLRTGRDVDQRSGMELERRVVAGLFDTEDRVEGMSAFLAKRPATFRGR